MLLASGVLATAAALAPDSRLAGCGGANPNNQVRSAFELARARDFWSHFPSAPRGAPELETDETVYVVVFEGPVQVSKSVTLHDVVCVLRPPSDLYPDGEPLVYYDVPLEGFKP